MVCVVTSSEVLDVNYDGDLTTLHKSIATGFCSHIKSNYCYSIFTGHDFFVLSLDEAICCNDMLYVLMCINIMYADIFRLCRACLFLG